MAQTLYRMSNSSIIRESEDIGCGIFDADGREFCESETSPMHIGSLPFYIRGFMRKLEGQIDDGDIIIHNHPYHGASHTPDLGVCGTDLPRRAAHRLRRRDRASDRRRRRRAGP